MKLKMRTTATLLIAILMISALNVMSIGAPADGYTEAVLNAADRLVQMQNPDGGFKWQVDPQVTEPGSGASGYNTLGITAMGILKAHELLDKPEYETALAKAYFYATQNGVGSHTLYYAFPDVTFLIWLGDACVDDTSLFDAIVAKVQGTTIEDIRTLAESIWTDRLADGRKGTEIGRDFTATEMAEYLLGVRGSLGFWDLGAAVKAALALGLDADAQAIADVMYAHLLSDTPFDIEDTTDVFYALALSGAIEGFSELGVYPTITRTMTDLLIINQDGTGYWDQGGDAASDLESVQATSYAVMALIAQGDADALAAAKKGDDWLVSKQNTNGGWFPGYTVTTLENLEVDSEAAWALSGLVKSTHEYICVWWLEDAVRKGGDGTDLGGWIDDRIPPASPVGYVEFKVTGRAYHGDMEWFYNYRPLEDFEASPLVIANGKFSAWARYISPRSGLPILDKIRGTLTISQGTANGEYVQYSYAFGTADEVLDWYPNAKESPRTQGMWLIGITYYDVHGQTPT